MQSFFLTQLPQNALPLDVLCVKMPSAYPKRCGGLPEPAFMLSSLPRNWRFEPVEDAPFEQAFVQSLPLLVAHYHDLMLGRPATPDLIALARRTSRLFWAYACALSDVVGAQPSDQAMRRLLSLFLRVDESLRVLFAELLPYDQPVVDYGQYYVNYAHLPSFAHFCDQLLSKLNQCPFLRARARDGDALDLAAKPSGADLYAAMMGFAADVRQLFKNMLMGEQVDYTELVHSLSATVQQYEGRKEGFGAWVAGQFSEKGVLADYAQHLVMGDAYSTHCVLLMQSVTNTLLQRPTASACRLSLLEGSCTPEQLCAWLLWQPVLLPHGEDPFGAYVMIRTCKTNAVGEVVMTSSPTRYRLGRFLRKFKPRFLATDAQLRNAVYAIRLAHGRVEIDFIPADDPQAWEAVYQVDLDPGNCMLGSRLPRLYACANALPAQFVRHQMDIALAVMRDTQGRIRARTIVNRRNRSFVRVYGETPFRNCLERLGYVLDPELTLSGYFIRALHLTGTLFEAPCVDGRHGDSHSACARLVEMDCHDAVDSSEKATFWLLGEGPVPDGCTTSGNFVLLDDIHGVIELFENPAKFCVCCGTRCLPSDPTVHSVDTILDIVAEEGQACPQCYRESYHFFPSLHISLHKDAVLYSADGEPVPDYLPLAIQLGFNWDSSSQQFERLSRKFARLTADLCV